MRAFQNIRGLNIREMFKEFVRAVLPSPDKLLARQIRRVKRLLRYRARNASYPYSSKRQHERYGRQRMDVQQARSHLPTRLEAELGVVKLWPNHLGEKPFQYRDEVPA